MAEDAAPGQPDRRRGARLGSRRPDHPSGAHQPDRRRGACRGTRRLGQILVAASLVGVLTACTYGRHGHRKIEPEFQITEDSREESTTEEFVSAAEALAAVDSVEETDDYAFDVELLEDASSTELDTASTRLQSLVDDYVYDGESLWVEVHSGSFSGNVGASIVGMPAAGWHPEPLPLGEIPYMKSLPGAESGDLGIGGGVEVVIAEGEPLDEPVLDVIEHDTELEFTLTQDRGGVRAPAEFVIDPNALDVADDVRGAFRAAERAGHPLIGWKASDSGGLKALIEVEDVSEIEPAYESFERAYQDVDGLRFADEDGLVVTYAGDPPRGADRWPEGGEIEDYWEAAELLRERGVDVAAVDMPSDAITIRTTDPDDLRAAVDTTGWPLHYETRITVETGEPETFESSRADSEYGEDPESYLSIRGWQHYVDVLANLWDAGIDGARVHAPIDDDEEDFGAEVTIDIVSAELIDHEQPAARDELIRIIRDTGWEGVAMIKASGGFDSLEFSSTETGEAENASMRIPGSDDDDAFSDWGTSFVEAWNATAG